MYVVDGWCIWKYKLLVVVFMGMYIRVIGLLTTNVYVFFHQVAWPCLIWQGKRCFKFRTTNCSAQLWCFMLFVFVNVISCSWEFNPKYPDVKKQYLDSKALPTVPTGESLCLWSRTARELPASRLVTARTARWWGFQMWPPCWKGGWMWGRDRGQIVWDACHLVSTLCLSLSLALNICWYPAWYPMLYQFVHLSHQDLRCHLSMNSKLCGSFQSIVLLTTYMRGECGRNPTDQISWVNYIG